ncbi:MAG: hypothetical protein CMD18_06380 [Flavobacteriales bacterium]|nr:hypothetical protein [Flavobacteriales bacterium]
MKKIVVFILILSSLQLFGQTKVWLNFGDKALQEGDYYGASRFYLKAWAEDSTFDGLTYKLGLAFKGYHNTRKALYYFKKIENNKALQIKHADYLFHLAELYKSLEDYKLSRTYFEKFSRVKKSNSYRYLKSKHELEVHQDIIDLIEDTVSITVRNLGNEINTGVAEYYSVWLNDSMILYSSLKASDVTPDGVVKDDAYIVKIYTGYKQDTVWYEGDIVLASKFHKVSFTDGSFDNDGEFYFAKQENQSDYKLFKTRVFIDDLVDEDGGGFFKLRMDSIQPIFIEDEYNYRNPFVLNSDGIKYLLFSSNLPGGLGKMDLWYSENKNGIWEKPRNLGSKINSPGDEIGPFYDSLTNRFYFSSNWHYGLGGFDLFEAKGFWKKPSSIINMGIPFNSSSNDLYLSPLDSLRGLFTSSRRGSQTSKDAACCNDLYEYQAIIPPVDSALLEIIEVLSRDSIMKRLKRLVEEFHVTLYFQNDRPNPDNWDTITSYSYLDTYKAYLDSLPTYYIRNTNGKSGKDSITMFNKINDFFEEYVHKGLQDLKFFSKELLKELEMGSKILLTVKGYASPLAKSGYNVNLTLRRINSLQNYLRDYADNSFVPYLDGTAENGGLLKIKKIPFGEFKSDTLVSDDYFNTKMSVYSKEASLERRVEIINLTLLDEDSLRPAVLLIDLDSSQTLFNLGILDTSVFIWRFELKNPTDQLIKIVEIDAGCHCLSPKADKMNISAKNSNMLEVQVDLSKYIGKLGRKIELILEDGTRKSIILLMELPKK